jgi:hypothetical protein
MPISYQNQPTAKLQNNKSHINWSVSSQLNNEKYIVEHECNKTMTFYAQVDSIGDQFDLADCMVIHNFVCFDCFEVKAILSKV